MWRPLTEDDVRAIMNSPEDSAARARYLAAGQADPLVALIETVTADLRDAIRTNPENTLAADETFLPTASIGHAAVIIRHALLGRFGQVISDGRMKEWDAAQKHLEKIEKGIRKVSVPGSAGSISKPPTLAPAINQSPRREGWRDQDGI